jgi:hypothetical protein
MKLEQSFCFSISSHNHQQKVSFRQNFSTYKRRIHYIKGCIHYIICVRISLRQLASEFHLRTYYYVAQAESPKSPPARALARHRRWLVTLSACQRKAQRQQRIIDISCCARGRHRLHEFCSENLCRSCYLALPIESFDR